VVGSAVHSSHEFGTFADGGSKLPRGALIRIVIHMAS
jgi:hypothetical protein